MTISSSASAFASASSTSQSSAATQSTSPLSSPTSLNHAHHFISIKNNCHKLSFHVPSITKCLLFVQRFARDNNVFFEFLPNHFVVKDQASKTPVLSCKSDGGLYTLQPSSISKSTSPSSALYSIKASPSCWHLRLGHPYQ
ncbi:hypothetical protein KY285_030664 [Solanum tuberosum]|nr:hypothetical protein KY285_030664 [Solanum tuberosum]